MPLPLAYSEADLALFCHTALEPVATTLGWSPASSSILEAVNDATIAYGVTDLADATDVPKLRAVARVAAWRAVVRATAGFYRFSTDQQAFDRQQVHEHARAMVAEAEREAAAVGAGPALLVAAVVRDAASDPFVTQPAEWGVVA